MMHRRNKRVVGAHVPIEDDLTEELVAARMELLTHTLVSMALRKGRVVVWPSLVSATRFGRVYVRAETAPRPSWKRVRA